MVEKITAHMCPVGLELGIDYTSLSSLIDGVDENEEEQKITVKLVPNLIAANCVPPANGQFTVEMVPDFEPDPCESGCGYYRRTGDIDYLPYEPATLEGFLYKNPRITILNPDHCQLSRSNIVLHGPSSIEPTGDVRVTTIPGVPGDIPEDPDEIAPLAGSSQEWIISQNVVVPGMAIHAEHQFSNGQNIVIKVPSIVWYTTAAIIGGTIVSVNGDYGDPALTYTVKIFGGNHAGIKSTDFAEWEVGDWVFLTKLGSCDTINNVGPVSEEGFSASGWAITPMEVNNYGA